jgi:hypothetical protein
MYRRRFLGSAAGLAVGLVPSRPAQASPPNRQLPTIQFRDHALSRLILGSNPFYGYSHLSSVLDQCMREWYTPDRRVAVLHAAERAGINTWQVHYNDPTLDDWKRYRAEGGRMNVLMLADFELMRNWKLLPQVARLGPIGIAHHGNRTDERFRAGQMDVVHDFTKAVHDAGVPAGVSMHNPAVLQYIEDKGWAVDYYMTCLYRVSRTGEETRKEFGEAPLGEAFMENDPVRMTAMVRKTSKTCFVFKLLGAGRANRPEQVEGAFRFAIRNVKPQDAFIVGMFPKFKDQIRENIALVNRLSAEAAS